MLCKQAVNRWTDNTYAIKVREEKREGGREAGKEGALRCLDVKRGSEGGKLS